MSAIKCGQCGHENDQTRVFCQNCGTRLERPQGQEAVITGPTESPTKGKPLPQKGRKIRGEGGQFHFVPWLFKRILWSAVLGFLVAVVVQAWREPSDVPPSRPPNEAIAARSYEMLRSSSASPFERSYDLSEDQINNYLAANVKAETVGSSLPTRAEFQRAFVVVQPNHLRFFVQQKQMGWPVYFYVDVVPGPDGSGNGKVKGGGIGRLPLNGPLTFLPQRFVEPVYHALEQSLEPLQKANRVTLAPPVVKLKWTGQSRTP